MLELRNIKKDYPAGDGVVHALRGIDLQFRNSEFVSILGQSGCGKTTMLNIIGGLDSYTEGDLVINGRSTKDYKDRDWDSYRNHSVGFVFQSYNLIPHQSVLQNVELALSLSGVSKSERRRRAKEALERVGLAEQIHKRPGEMSGGQMQRVAIARAIVNDPDIILADEPTGALDTETSVQVMEILKEISRDRLVIMVTHNPELAQTYSTRIVRMLDGNIIGDSAPMTEAEVNEQRGVAVKKREEKAKTKMPSMSFATSFGLSLKNLFTKKGRTTLTAFAGSIGIIGIALILAVSQGMTAYIDTVQEETLSSYPLTLQEQHTDLGDLLESFISASAASSDHEKDAVYQKPILFNLVNTLNSAETKENDLGAFKKYLEEQCADEESELYEAVNGVQYSYNMDMLIYTKNVDGSILESDSQKLLQQLLMRYMSGNLSNMTQSGENSGMNAGGGGMMSMFGGTSSGLWQEMLKGEKGNPVNDLLAQQYDVVYGTWPTAYNEVVLVLDENNELDDMSLYALGLKSEKDINALVDAAIQGTVMDFEAESWTYEEICEREYRTVLPADCYKLDETTGLYTDLRNTDAGLQFLYSNGTVLKVSGIIRPKEDALAPMLTGSIGYTHLLTEYVVEKAQESSALQAQLANKKTDIFTGLPFRDTNGEMSVDEKAEAFRMYFEELEDDAKLMAYVKTKCVMPAEALQAAVDGQMAAMDRAAMESVLAKALSTQTGMSEEALASYVAEMSDEDLSSLVRQMLGEMVKAEYAAKVGGQYAAMLMDPAQSAMVYAQMQNELPTFTNEQCAQYYDETLEFSTSTYEENLRLLSHVDLEEPSAIHLYAASFESKDMIEEAISDYNNSVDELSRISYTDYVGLMMSSVTTIINAITYVLIAFVAISLVVSSIMIGVITLISVQERTKEIGILRAIGASKRNVSGMFNAETVIIGFAAGLLGVLITYLLCIPINLILHALTGIGNLDAILPVPAAIVLVAISVFLTLLAGIIPSRSAAKKDPVVALRTE